MPDDNKLFGSGVFLHIGGRVLLQKRTHDTPSYPDYWGSFGGHAEQGEAPESAAIREIEEELGIALKPSDLKFVCVIQIFDGSDSWEVHYYSSPLTILLSEITLGEGNGFALFTREEIIDLRLTPDTKSALDEFFDS